jgi:hypothetical protein
MQEVGTFDLTQNGGNNKIYHYKPTRHVTNRNISSTNVKFETEASTKCLYVCKYAEQAVEDSR